MQPRFPTVQRAGLSFFAFAFLACGQKAADVHAVAPRQRTTPDASVAAASLPPTLPQPPAPPEPTAEADFASISASTSTSLGSPNDGRLEGGLALPESGLGFLHNPRRTNSEARHGTVELVRALLRAAAVVDQELPGGRLVVNDVGLPGGGPIPRHGSHQSGRDVDVLFYLHDPAGNPVPSVGAPIDPRGLGWDFRDLSVREDDVRVRFDAARTWRFAQALAEDTEAHLQRIFIAEHLRTLLLAHAASTRVPRAVRERVGEAMCQPRMPHDDHLHIRLFCSAEDIRAGCQDSYPIYPWRRTALATEGVAPLLERLRPERRRAPTVSHEEALRRAGQVHWLVEKFLAEREVWLPQPHPGRRWCP